MQCEKFENRMHELLDRREPPELDAVLREHALVCGECAEQLAAQESLFAGLKLGTPPELSADFTQRVLSQAVPKSKNRPSNKLLLGLLVLAAALLVALLPVSWLRQFRGGTGNHELRNPRSNLPVADRSQRPDTNELQPGRQQNPGNSHRPDSPGPRNAPPEEAREFAVAPPDAGTSDRHNSDYADIPSIEDLAGLPAGELRSFVDRVATPLKPVTNSVNGAINVLRRTLAARPAWPLDPRVDEKPQADTSHPGQTQDLA